MSAHNKRKAFKVFCCWPSFHFCLFVIFVCMQCFPPAFISTLCASNEGVADFRGGSDVAGCMQQAVLPHPAFPPLCLACFLRSRLRTRAFGS
jgi:hypothetical protein